MIRIGHLAWIPCGALVGFGAALVFGDLLTLPVDLYYLIYFALVGGFFALYAGSTRLELRPVLARRLSWGILLGLAVGGVMLANVLSRPATPPLTGGSLAWAIAWRGVAYGAVDGLLLFAFPWIVTWRAFDAESSGAGRRVAAALTAWAMVLLVTTVYHLGYADFRSEKVLQPNIGSAISALPTLATANPVASPITHVVLHVGAVVHSPASELFLPPHRESACAACPDARVSLQPASGARP